MKRLFYLFVLALALVGCDPNAPEKNGEITVANRTSEAIDVHISPSNNNSRKFEDDWHIEVNSAHGSTVPIGYYFVMAKKKNGDFHEYTATVKPLDHTLVEVW